MWATLAVTGGVSAGNVGQPLLLNAGTGTSSTGTLTVGSSTSPVRLGSLTVDSAVWAQSGILHLGDASAGAGVGTTWTLPNGSTTTVRGQSANSLSGNTGGDLVITGGASTFATGTGGDAILELTANSPISLTSGTSALSLNVANSRTNFGPVTTAASAFVSVTGWSSFGPLSPQIRVALFTVACPADGGTVNISHTLDASKILDVACVSESRTRCSSN